MNFWFDKRVLVTGADGFLGKHVVKRLARLGATAIGSTGDLRERTTVSYNYWAATPEIVIHLAALSGGIQKNMQRPADMFFDNLQMGMNIIEVGKNFSTPVKIIMMGSACEYPKLAATPIKESSLWSGYPEETNGAYGIAKRALEAMGRAYRAQYGTNVIHLLSANLYGPGDNFGNGSHFIPAVIRQCTEARKAQKDSLTLWGTGKATRDFLYVDDVVEGILLAAEHYNEPAPVNLGSGRELSIYEVAEKINILTGFNGELLWDGKMPDGQPRRVLDTKIAREKFGFEAKTLVECGLRETIAWYSEKLRSGR
jgi:GDP-L-fucose synthase